MQRFQDDFGIPRDKLLYLDYGTMDVVNTARARDRYRQAEIDHTFRDLLVRLDPDIVHFGHLSHLSTSMVLEARSYGTPVIFTLHDYWLMCPRGQFIQISPADPSDVWAMCDGQEDRAGQ